MPDMARYDPFTPNYDHPLLNSSPDYGALNTSYRARPIGDLAVLGNQLSFRERNKRLRSLEDEKNQLIEDLLYQLENTQAQLDRMQLDHTREAQFNREGHLREQSLHDQLRQVKALMDRCPYVTVLIDGDGTMFTRELWSQGEIGGREAAAQLAASLKAYTRNNLPHLESPKIVVRIYANAKALCEALLMCRIIDKPSTFDDFLRGLNSSQQLLLDFVDAGTRCGAAREKICESIQLELYNVHCHQVVVGCSHDNEYSKILRETSEDASVLDHITLLEGQPFETDIAPFKDIFKTARFDSVFCTKKLTTPSAFTMPKGPLQAVTATIPLCRLDTNCTNGSNSSSSTPATTWATMASGPPSKPSTTRTSTPVSIQSPAPVSAAVAKPAPVATKAIERNRQGLRIDRADSSIPNHEIQRIKKLKLCNVFYLQGPTFCTSNNCSHSHTYPLSKGERIVLREVARMTPCYYKLDCTDADCIYGHRCPQNKADQPSCWYGEDCRFWGWGHGIDTRVVKTTKV